MSKHQRAMIVTTMLILTFVILLSCVKTGRPPAQVPDWKVFNTHEIESPEQITNFTVSPSEEGYDYIYIQYPKTDSTSSREETELDGLRLLETQYGTWIEVDERIAGVLQDVDVFIFHDSFFYYLKGLQMGRIALEEQREGSWEISIEDSIGQAEDIRVVKNPEDPAMHVVGVLHQAEGFWVSFFHLENGERIVDYSIPNAPANPLSAQGPFVFYSRLLVLFSDEDRNWRLDCAGEESPYLDLSDYEQILGVFTMEGPQKETSTRSGPEYHPDTYLIIFGLLRGDLSGLRLFKLEEDNPGLAGSTKIADMANLYTEGFSILFGQGHHLYMNTPQGIVHISPQAEPPIPPPTISNGRGSVDECETQGLWAGHCLVLIIFDSDQMLGHANIKLDGEDHDHMVPFPLGKTPEGKRIYRLMTYVPPGSHTLQVSGRNSNGKSNTLSVTFECADCPVPTPPTIRNPQLVKIECVSDEECYVAITIESDQRLNTVEARIGGELIHSLLFSETANPDGSFSSPVTIYVPVGTHLVQIVGINHNGSSEPITFVVTCYCVIPSSPVISFLEELPESTDEEGIQAKVRSSQVLDVIDVWVNGQQQTHPDPEPTEYEGDDPVYSVPIAFDPGTNLLDILGSNTNGTSNLLEEKVEHHGITFDSENPKTFECDINRECTVQLVFWANYIGVDFRVTVGEDEGEWRGGHGGNPVNGRYPYHASVTVPEGSHLITISVRYNNQGFDAVDTISTEIDCQCHIPVGYRLETTIPVGRITERPVDIFRSLDSIYQADILTTDPADTSPNGTEARRVYKAGCTDESCGVVQKKPEGHTDEKKYGNFHGISQGTMLGNILQLCSGGILVDFVGGVISSFFSNLSGVMGAMHSSGVSGRFYQVAKPSDPIAQRSGTMLETYLLYDPGLPETQRSIPTGIIDITAVDTISKTEVDDNPFKDLIIAADAETRQIVSFTPAGDEDPTVHFTMDPEHGRITSIDVLTATADETKVLVTTITDGGIAKTHIIDIQSGSYINGFVTHDSLDIDTRDEGVFYVAVSDDEGRIYVIHSHFHGVQVWVEGQEVVSCCR